MPIIEKRCCASYWKMVLFACISTGRTEKRNTAEKEKKKMKEKKDTMTVKKEYIIQSHIRHLRRTTLVMFCTSKAVLKLPKSARFTESSMLWEITMKIQFLRLRSP